MDNEPEDRRGGQADLSVPWTASGPASLARRLRKIFRGERERAGGRGMVPWAFGVPLILVSALGLLLNGYVLLVVLGLGKQVNAEHFRQRYPRDVWPAR